MRRIYYFVPPCPVCGSRRTGRYLREPLMDHDYTYLESLKNGEWVRFADSIPDDNCFCMDCGHRWHKVINPVLLNSEQIEDEKAIRGTFPVYQKEMAARHPVPKKSGSRFSRFVKGFFCIPDKL